MLRVPTISGTRIDRHRLHHRHGEQEHHVRAVHGEDLVVEVGPDARRLSGRASCRRIEHRQHAAQREEDEGGGDVAAADDLVVDGGERAEKPARRPPDRVQLRVAARPASSSVSRRSGGDARRGSLQAGQLGGDSAFSSSPAQRHQRHVVARLDRLRIGDPGRERAARGRQHAGGDILAAADMGEVRAEHCRRPACRAPCGRRRRPLPGTPARPALCSGVAGCRRLGELCRRASARTPPAARRPPAAPYARAAGRRTRRTARGRCRADRR